MGEQAKQPTDEATEGCVYAFVVKVVAGFWPAAGKATGVRMGAWMVGVLAAAGAAAADDRHEGYYYPELTSTEVYQARSFTIPESNRKARVAFVTGITNEQNKAPYPPQAAIFAKGSEAEKLIIVALEDGRIDTIYRARAIFAQMTAVARLLPVFSQLGVEDYFTFFNLLKMLGFTQLTITDGHTYAHQVTIE